MNNSENNSTNTSNQIEKSSASGMVMLYMVTVPVIALLIAIACLVLLKTSLKKLNKIIKNILIVLCSHTILSSSFVGIAYLVSFYDTGIITCSVIFVVMKSTVMVTIENLALISFVRYHLAWKTDNNENFNMFIIIGLILAIYIVEYISQTFEAIFFGHPFITSCSGIPQDNNKFSLILTFIRILFSLGIGTIYDVILIKFLRKKNKSANGPGQAKLVPWKSSNQGAYDFKVPISATVIAVIVLLISATGFVILFTWSNQIQYLPMATHFTAFALPSIVLPLLLALSIRAIKKTKPLPQVPKGPMFHENKSSVDHNEPEGNQSFELVEANVPERLHNKQLQEPDFKAGSSNNIIYVQCSKVA